MKGKRLTTSGSIADILLQHVGGFGIGTNEWRGRRVPGLVGACELPPANLHVETVDLFVAGHVQRLAIRTTKRHVGTELGNGNQSQRNTIMVDHPDSSASGEVQISPLIDCESVGGRSFFGGNGRVEEHASRADGPIALDGIASPIHGTIIGHVEPMPIIRDFQTIGNLHVFEIGRAHV